jgi:hypothetical protein
LNSHAAEGQKLSKKMKVGKAFAFLIFNTGRLGCGLSKKKIMILLTKKGFLLGKEKNDAIN